MKENKGQSRRCVFSNHLRPFPCACPCHARVPLLMLNQQTWLKARQTWTERCMGNAAWDGLAYHMCRASPAAERGAGERGEDTAQGNAVPVASLPLRERTPRSRSSWPPEEARGAVCSSACGSSGLWELKGPAGTATPAGPGPTAVCRAWQACPLCGRPRAPPGGREGGQPSEGDFCRSAMWVCGDASRIYSKSSERRMKPEQKVETFMSVKTFIFCFLEKV